MGVLAWVVAPWLGGRLGGAEPLAQALLLLLTAGLVWQCALVLLLTRRELAGLRWARVREALWLRAPRDPRSGRTGGRVWWWLLPFVALLVVKEALSGAPGPVPRDFAAFLGSDRGQAFFRGAWGWFAVVVACGAFNTALGEELLFRGLLLPRMCGVFGRWDWVANGVLFAAYHVHVPRVIPSTRRPAPGRPQPDARRRPGEHEPADDAARARQGVRVPHHHQRRAGIAATWADQSYSRANNSRILPTSAPQPVASGAAVW
jgi:membrane protease YdiL (CAAX protease family)